MHLLCTTKKVLQKQLAKINLRVPGKSCDEIDDDVMIFILQYIWVRNMKVIWDIRYIIFHAIF